MQHLVQTGRVDGPADYSSCTLAAIRLRPFLSSLTLFDETFTRGVGGADKTCFWQHGSYARPPTVERRFFFSCIRRWCHRYGLQVHFHERGEKGLRPTRPECMHTPRGCVSEQAVYRGTSLIRNCHPPWDHHRAFGINLR